MLSPVWNVLEWGNVEITIWTLAMIVGCLRRMLGLRSSDAEFGVFEVEKLGLWVGLGLEK